jgi:hypothetical protein
MNTERITDYISDHMPVLILLAVAIPIIMAPIHWIAASHFESKAYNQITGANTTTWDAMWLELRVQGSPENNRGTP